LAALLAGGLLMASMAQALEVGERAPDFTLPSTTGEKISLNQFRGKKLVLLEFHVNDFGAT
jgi:thioredoxin-dependent peroxiredoxin